MTPEERIEQLEDLSENQTRWLDWIINECARTVYGFGAGVSVTPPPPTDTEIRERRKKRAEESS